MEKLNKTISIIIPTYNEEANIKPLVERIHEALFKKGIIYELIFIDDNSRDQTCNIIQELALTYPIILSLKRGRAGKAFSISEGIRYAQFGAIAMIDADLQYPPEALPEMLEKLGETDIVVANRKKYKDSVRRKVLSNTFRAIFGKALFGLSHDIQSGLKVFTKEVADTLKFEPSSAWTFDLEFLHRAKQAGFTIQNHDIVFSKRKNGESKLNFIKQTLEIGTNAVIVRTKRIHPVHIPPKTNDSMLGAGLGFKKKKYITHTTIAHSASALTTVTLAQKIIILLLVSDVALGFYLATLLTLQIIVAILSFIYFIDVLFNLYLIMKSLAVPAEIRSSDEEIEALADEDLPVYTILCPLYREAPVIPQFLEAIGKISWPKKKLDVILLLEEDDRETIKIASEMDLPSYVKTLIVPHSVPKTKPKACNYGLAHARGEYLVIYDAEDIPDPFQLKKAYLGFKKVKKDTICLQAKLNYYNPHQNLLTRFFTAEYSLWFDVTLTGLQSIDTTIPLGGTSNHFKTASLREIEGWDPFNVTEDADLGVRLFRKGYKTAIIDSTTLEEANSRFGNWLRQRSRWIKGYMQTYLVHNRDLPSKSKSPGIHSLIFHLVIGGKIAFILINPLLWFATFSYFALYAYVGPQIEALYPSVVFYMAASSLIFGNFLFLYYYMIGVAKKGQWNLMKFVFLIPLYWLAISIAAFIALYQLILKPHYWEKTVHGLHLNKKEKEEVIVEEIIEVAKKSGFVFPARIRKRLGFDLSKEHLAGIVFVFAAAVGSFFNFAYNAYLGRVLTFEDFALVGFISGIFSFVTIIISSYGSTVGYKTGHLIGRFGEGEAITFWRKMRSKSLLISLVSTVLWLTLTPILANFFHLGSVIPLVLFAPILFVGFIYSADKGFLSSRLSFITLAIIVIFEPLLKFAFSLLLVTLGLDNLAYTAVPISTVYAFLLCWLFVAGIKLKRHKAQANHESAFPKRFFTAALASSFSTVIFLNLDVILAKHFLTSAEAGAYALTALIAKMVFFIGSFASFFIIPLVSRNEGANRDSKKVLNFTLLATIILTIPAFVALGIFGKTTAPFLFGEKALSVVPYLLPVTFAMVCFSIARVFSDYYLAKGYYSFSAVAVILGILQIILLDLTHSGVGPFVYIMSAIWMVYLALVLLLHAFSWNVKLIENNLADFFGLFTKIREGTPRRDAKLRILIFNWYDVKHVWAGGAEINTHNIAKVWVKQGYDVTMFTGNDAHSSRYEIIDGIQVIRRGGLYTVALWGMIYYLLKFRDKYDVVIDIPKGVPFFTPLYVQKPILCLIHQVHQEMFRKELKFPSKQLSMFLEGTAMPLLYRNVGILTISPSAKSSIEEMGMGRKEPIQIVYPGVGIKKAKIAKTHFPSVTYLGRLRPYKNVDLLIKAVAILHKNMPSIKLVIAGTGEDAPRLKKIVSDLKLDSVVAFAGKITEEEKAELFTESWVAVQPSMVEGWGITNIEANICGTPVVVANSDGLRDSVLHNKTGVLVKAGNAQALADGISKIVEDKKFRQSLEKNAIEWGPKFSWDDSASKFMNIINQHLEKRLRVAKASAPAFVSGKN